MESVTNFVLLQAYRINTVISELTSYIRGIRPAYLASTSQPHQPLPSRKHRTGARDRGQAGQGFTDNERTRIDYELKTLLTSLHTAIRSIAEKVDAESTVQNEILARKRRKRLGVLRQWAAGGGITAKNPEEIEEESQLETTRVWREAVVWFLQRQLEGASEVQRKMVQIRLDRERERNKSSLYRAKGPTTIGLVNGSNNFRSDASSLSNSKDMGRAVNLESEQRQDGAWKDLSPEQLQLFEKEQQDMLKHYNDEVNKIKTAESSLLEISSLQSQLTVNLDTQSAHIDQLIQDSYLTSEQVGAGNKELKRASERPSTARILFWSTSAFCAALVTWDCFI